MKFEGAFLISICSLNYLMKTPLIYMEIYKNEPY